MATLTFSAVPGSGRGRGAAGRAGGLDRILQQTQTSPKSATQWAWLQRLSPPIIIAPKHKAGQAITRFVPNNDGDKKFDRQERLTAKTTVPTLFLLEPGQKPEVHYAWDISDCADAPVDRIRDAARSLDHAWLGHRHGIRRRGPRGRSEVAIAQRNPLASQKRRVAE